jgi:hypothetical protein
MFLPITQTMRRTFPKTTAHLPLSADVLDKREILVGGPTPAGHVPCILKFSPADSDGGGAVEFAYMKMAKAAGIRVPPTCLVNDGQRRHFAAQRFDRYLATDGTTAKRHVHTLSGLLHRRASDGQSGELAGDYPPRTHCTQIRTQKSGNSGHTSSLTDICSEFVEDVNISSAEELRCTR